MKMGKCCLFLMLAFLTVAIPGALWAQGPTGPGGKNKYAVIKLGSYIPESGDMDQLDAKNGFSGEIGFGYHLYPNFALEAAVGYFETKASTAIPDTDRKFRVYPLEVAGRFVIPLGFVEPHFSLGLGGYYVKAKAGNYEETSTVLGGFLGGGVNFNLSKTVFLGVEARYLILTAPAPIATPYSGSAWVNVDLDGFILTGNLGFRF